MSKPWFIVKRYGFGATPSGWSGWLFTIGFAVVLIFAAIWMQRTGSNGAAIFALPALILVFVVVAKLKGDGKRWRWRWGDDDS